jgi:hypothetical protein
MVKGKDIHVISRGGPHGCETSGVPHYLENRLTDGGEVVKCADRPLPLGRYLVSIYDRE